MTKRNKSESNHTVLYHPFNQFIHSFADTHSSLFNRLFLRNLPPLRDESNPFQSIRIIIIIIIIIIICTTFRIHTRTQYSFIQNALSYSCLAALVCMYVQYLVSVSHSWWYWSVLYTRRWRSSQLQYRPGLIDWSGSGHACSVQSIDLLASLPLPLCVM